MTPVQQVDDLPRMLAVAGHHTAAPFYLTTEMFGGLPFEMAAAELTELIDKPIADLHSHEVPEIYVLLSPEPGGAEIAVSVDGETYSMVAPSALLVPAGAAHRFLTKRAVRGSFCLGLLLHQTPESTPRRGEQEG
jgi:hypothetical protein